MSQAQQVHPLQDLFDSAYVMDQQYLAAVDVSGCPPRSAVPEEAAGVFINTLPCVESGLGGDLLVPSQSGR